MADAKLNLIGKVHSAQGVRGQVFVLLFPDSVPWLKNWKTLVVSDDETASSLKTEFKILNTRPHSKQGKNGYVLTLDTVADKDAADALAKKCVWIPTDFVTAKAGETLYLREIENFMVVDKQRGEVGEIIGFSSNGIQDLIQVQARGGMYEVPLVKAFIEKIEMAEKKIYMDIPMGLLEEIE